MKLHYSEVFQGLQDRNKLLCPKWNKVSAGRLTARVFQSREACSKLLRPKRSKVFVGSFTAGLHCVLTL
jgi:hypothetical protein